MSSDPGLALFKLDSALTSLDGLPEAECIEAIDAADDLDEVRETLESVREALADANPGAGL